MPIIQRWSMNNSHTELNDHNFYWFWFFVDIFFYIFEHCKVSFFSGFDFFWLIYFEIACDASARKYEKIPDVTFYRNFCVCLAFFAIMHPNNRYHISISRYEFTFIFSKAISVLSQFFTFLSFSSLFTNKNLEPENFGNFITTYQ